MANPAEIQTAQLADSEGSDLDAVEEPALALWQRPHLYRWGSLVIVLAVWELLGPSINPIFFSYPSAIVTAFFKLLSSGELWRYMSASLEILLYGMAFAVVVGIPLGVIMARVKVVNWSLEIYVNALYATPMVAVVPILTLWLGIDVVAKVTVVFLFAVFPVLINTYQGVRDVDLRIVEVARSFRSSEWDMWRDVLLPWAVPYIAAGVRLAIGRALVGMVIAELLTSITGLGYLITRYSHIFEMDKALVPVIILMFFGIVLTAALKHAERYVAPWSNKDS